MNEWYNNAEEILFVYKMFRPQLFKNWINLYPLDCAIGFPNTYPMDSDLSG